MYKVVVKGETADWVNTVGTKQAGIRSVLAGNPWRSAIIYDDQTRVIGRLSKRRSNDRRVWVDYYRGLEGIPAWSRRL